MNREQLTNVLPAVYKYTNSATVTLWKMGLGKFFNLFPAAFGKTLVVDFSRHGAKSPAQMALVYYPQGDVLYCTAFWNAQPDWYLNVVANPQVEVWLADGWYTANAELVQDEEERAQIMPKLVKNGGAAFTIKEKMTWVDLPEDDQAELPLLRIKRQSPCTGAEGPGSLAWLWPFLFFVFLLRPRHKH
jgi:deazaflavin-dependent oxidoreductase (nitroreductase family)